MNARADLHVPHEATVIGTVCRLESMKGVLALVDTFARFHRQHPTSVLVMVGDGSQREALVATAAAAGVAESVRMLEHRRDVLPVLWALDIFTMFSKAEGFCNATLEAMGVGLPVLATDVPGTREAVANSETGILFPYGDWDAAVEKMKALESSSDRARALGREARVGPRDSGMSSDGTKRWQHSFEERSVTRLLCKAERLPAPVGRPPGSACTLDRHPACGPARRGPYLLGGFCHAEPDPRLGFLRAAIARSRTPARIGTCRADEAFRGRTNDPTQHSRSTHADLA